MTMAGDYNITIKGTGCGKQRTTNFILTVNPSMFFSVDVNNPDSALIDKGDSVSPNVDVIFTGGNPSPVVLEALNKPPDCTITFVPSDTCTPTCQQTMVIDTEDDITPGTYTITVRGRGGGSESSDDFDLTIAPPFRFHLEFDPPSDDHDTVPQGEMATTTVNVVYDQGIRKTVDLSAEVVDMSGNPEPSISVSFSQDLRQPDYSSFVSIETKGIETGSPTPVGDYIVNIRGDCIGCADPYSDTITFLLTVTPGFDFEISVAPQEAEYYPSEPIPSPTVTVALKSGSTETVDLFYKIAPTPTGDPINVGFTVSSNNPTFSTSMNINTGEYTTPGKYTIYIIGNTTDNRLKHMTTFNLTVKNPECHSASDCGYPGPCKYYTCDYCKCNLHNRPEGYIPDDNGDGISDCGQETESCPDKCENDKEYRDPVQDPVTCNIACDNDGTCKTSCDPGACSYSTIRDCGIYGCKSGTDRCWYCYSCSPITCSQNEFQCISCCDLDSLPGNCIDYSSGSCGCSIPAQIRREDQPDPSCSYTWDCCTNWAGPVCLWCGWCTDVCTASCTYDEDCTYP